MTATAGTLSAGRNPFLFRGPIPTRSPVTGDVVIFESQSLLIQRSYSYTSYYTHCFLTMSSRNPFLFRGPIPTSGYILFKEGDLLEVAIPSYSEVLFLQ